MENIESIVKSEVAGVSEQELNARFQVFGHHYQSLCSCLNASPIDLKFRDLITREFANGFVWAKEAFNCAILDAKRSAEEKAIEEKIQETVKSCEEPVQACEPVDAA